jgi:hypothetical protein
MDYITGSGANSDPENSDMNKLMFTLVFSGYGLLVLEILPKEYTMNSDYFCDVVLQEIRTTVRATIEKTEIEETMIQMKNGKVHDSRKTTRKVEGFLVT